MIDLSCAALAAPPGVLQDALPAAAAALPRYAETEGYEPAGLPVLRAAVADRFTARGVPTGPEHILVSNGAMHAFDLLLQLLIGPGDRVLTELPTYPGAIDGVRRIGARTVSVPMASRRLGRRDDARDAAPDRAAAGLPHPRLPQPDRRTRRRRRTPRGAARRAADRHDRRRRRVLRRARVLRGYAQRGRDRLRR